MDEFMNFSIRTQGKIESRKIETSNKLKSVKLAGKDRDDAANKSTIRYIISQQINKPTHHQPNNKYSNASSATPLDSTPLHLTPLHSTPLHSLFKITNINRFADSHPRSLSPVLILDPDPLFVSSYVPNLSIPAVCRLS